jgi:hypothetical protein
LGNIVWHKGFGPDSSTQPYNYIEGIEQNNFDTSIVVSFSTHGFGGDVQELPWIPHDVYRSWNLFLNSQGNLQEQYSLGGNYDTYGLDILGRNDSSRFVLLGASSANTGDFSNSHITVNNNSGYYYEGYYAILDYWPLSVTHISDKEKKLTMYPNPSRSGFTIFLTSENEKEIEVNVRNVSGQLVQHNSFQAHQKNLIMSTSNLSNGLYFVEVKQGKDVYIGKLLKE